MNPQAVHVRVLDALLRSGGRGVKPGVLHRTAQKIAAAILRNRLSSTDPLHFGTLDLIYGLDRRDGAFSAEAVLALGRYVLRGRVIPIQRLHGLLDEARAIYLARCPCRASGRVRDRPDGACGAAGEDAARNDRLLEGILGAWERPAVRRAASPRLAAAIDRVRGARQAHRSDGTLEALFAATWPFWEVLLEHPGFDRCWLEGLAKNRKVWALPAALAHPWVEALYHGRGVVFTHMEAAGLPYAICSCPGPETDGGCMLTNWHYASGNDEILLPNEAEAFGRRRDAAGRVLACRKHPERAERPCLGCGCDHREDRDRG